MVARYVRSLPSDRPLRVLEVGAGTGSTTSFVLTCVPADRTEYVFTDISPLFAARAQEKFRNYPFVRYATLNIEHDPVGQGFAAGSFDLVLAANVLHATRDLAQTLSHVRRLLSPNGMLVLLEATERQRWVDLTFGLTEGWWRFADTARRPTHPLLTTAAWRALLVDSGFAETAIMPDPGSAEARACQETVIVARASEIGAERQTSGAPGRWLVYADAGGLGRAVADRLAASGDRVTLVRPGFPDRACG